jgi:hypothetical protein
MDDTPAKPKVGRPLKPIDAEQVIQLASIGCTQEEIAQFFSTTQSVISQRFRCEYEQGCSQSKITLRKRQWNASKRSVPMMIHLGKQMLGQADRVRTEFKAEGVIFECADDAADPQSEAEVLPPAQAKDVLPE